MLQRFLIFLNPGAYLSSILSVSPVPHKMKNNTKSIILTEEIFIVNNEKNNSKIWGIKFPIHFQEKGKGKGKERPER